MKIILVILKGNIISYFTQSSFPRPTIGIDFSIMQKIPKLPRSEMLFIFFRSQDYTRNYGEKND